MPELRELTAAVVRGIQQWRASQPFHSVFVYHGTDYLQKIRDDISYLKGEGGLSRPASSADALSADPQSLEYDAAFLEADVPERSRPASRALSSSLGPSRPGTVASMRLPELRLGALHSAPPASARSETRLGTASSARTFDGDDGMGAALAKVSSPTTRAAAEQVLLSVRQQAQSLSSALVRGGHLARARLHFALDRLHTPREAPCKITQMRGRIPRPPRPDK
jgi:hypothetical protein